MYYLFSDWCGKSGNFERNLRNVCRKFVLFSCENLGKKWCDGMVFRC